MYGIIRSGMSTAMHEIAVVSNNIANSGSTGFKKSDVSFNDIYGSATPDTVARTQAGFGSAIAGTRRNDGQGAIVDRAGALNLEAYPAAETNAAIVDATPVFISNSSVF